MRLPKDIYKAIGLVMQESYSAGMNYDDDTGNLTKLEFKAKQSLIIEIKKFVK